VARFQKDPNTILKELWWREQVRMTTNRRWARLEHAWLLKAEGLRLEDIGLALGVSRERARQMVVKFGRRARYATHLSHWRISYDVDH
jgi:DNA-directed RNA polymerase sigma subunit (sigma70/sigma32)